MLEGKLTRLRPVEEKDIDCYLTWINAPELARLVLGFIAPISRIQIFKTFKASFRFPGNNLFFAIEISSEAKPIGFYFLKSLHLIHRFAELEQFFIGEKKYRQNGYGRDALEILLNYCFAELNLNRLWVLTYSYNQETIHFYEKCSFSKEGILRQGQFIMGQYQDGIIMAVLIEDPLSKNQS